MNTHPTSPRLIRRKTLILGLLALGLNFAGSASAQSYAVPRAVVGAGGGTSTTAVYTVTATLGQTASGVASGGAYSISGGYWGTLGVVPTQGAPDLRIFRSGAEVVLAWPGSAAAFQLQESSSLTAPRWTDVRAAPTTVGPEQRVPVPMRSGARFFRLRRL